MFWPDYNDRNIVTTWVHNEQFPPNGFGLHHVHGNVTEFTRGLATWDYTDVVQEGGDAVIVGGTRPLESSAVFRGGSYWKRVEHSRSAKRTFVDKRARFDNVGLRISRPIR